MEIQTWVETMSKEEIPLKHFSLRRCMLIRIGRNDEKNQHLQEKWTISIIKEVMKVGEAGMQH